VNHFADKVFCFSNTFNYPKDHHWQQAVALQAGTSRVRDPMRLMIFINLHNPSGHTRPWGLLASNKNEYQKQKNHVSGE
jgi:hypothetical protein